MRTCSPPLYKHPQAHPRRPTPSHPAPWLAPGHMLKGHRVYECPIAKLRFRAWEDARGCSLDTLALYFGRAR